MKVQMQDQILRLRISEAELARLQAGEVVGNVTHLPGGIAHRQTVQLVDDDTPALVATTEGWNYRLPRDLLVPYVARLPCRDGLAVSLPVGEGAELAVEFEVDVRDSVRSGRTPRRRTQAVGGPDRGPS